MHNTKIAAASGGDLYLRSCCMVRSSAVLDHLLWATKLAIRSVARNARFNGFSGWCGVRGPLVAELRTAETRKQGGFRDVSPATAPAVVTGPWKSGIT